MLDGLRTWQLELAAVACVLAATLAGRASLVELVGAAAVLASFAHAQVADRLAEYAGTSPNDGDAFIWKDTRVRLAVCWRWSTRYFVTKELLWLVYFIAHRSWSALVGVGVFLVYPLWRKWWRKQGGLR